ncbi:MAG TPA: hypothetical protein DEH78_30250 [Solibacterales bacterium]|nr:hypothetical protein [Bryobacterales bacterium]
MPARFALAYSLLFGVCLASASTAGGYRTRAYPLPAFTPNRLAVTSDGILWVAANDGLHRFDGFRYSLVPGFPYTRPGSLAVTSDGVLWIGGEFGLVRYEKSQFRLVNESWSWALAAARDVLFYADRDGFWRTDRSGRKEWVAATKDSVQALPGAEGSVWFAYGDGPAVFEVAPEWGAQPVREVIPGGAWRLATGDSTGRRWLEDARGVSAAGNGPPDRWPARIQDTVRLRGLIVPSGREPVLLSVPPRLLRSGLELELPGPDWNFPQDVALAPDGRFWGAFLGKGLVEWIPEQTWERWSIDSLSAGALVQTLGTPNGATLLAARSGLLIRSGQGWRPLGPRGIDLTAATEARLHGGGYWLLTRERVLRLNTAGELQEEFSARPSLPKPNERIVALWDFGPRGLWVASDNALYTVTGQPGQRQFTPQRLPGQGEQIVAYEFKEGPDGQLYFGWAGGIAVLQDGGWRGLDTTIPFSDVRSVEFTASGDIWAAHRTPGSYAYLRRMGGGARWSVEEFRAADGYTPALTRWIRTDSRGWLWRGVADGMLVSDGRHVGPSDWLHVRASHGYDVGLPTANGFREDADGSIWLTGDGALVHFRPDPLWFAARRVRHAPLLHRSIVGARDARFELSSPERDERRLHPLEYRLRPVSAEWRGTATGEVVFEYLPDGAYSLEVRYAGTGGPPLVTHFTIGTPPPRFSPWWGLAAAGLSLGGLGAWRSGLLRRAHYRLSKWIYFARRRFQLAQAGGGSARLVHPGDILGPGYQVQRLLADGGFSRVYAGVAVHGGPVALKVLHPASDPSWARRRFAHEVSCLRSLAHPGVVQLYDAWVEPDGLMVLALELVEGERLRDLLKAEVPVLRALRILTDLAAVLDRIHEQGIVHLDVKPENVVAADGRIVLLDFGTAAYRGPEDELAVTRMLSGSPAYMAPERLTGRYSPASDIYALGVIAVELLSRRAASEFSAGWYEEGFVPELAAALRPEWGDAALAAAAAIAEALQSEPGRRPKEAGAWVLRLNSLITQSRPA